MNHFRCHGRSGQSYTKFRLNSLKKNYRINQLMCLLLLFYQAFIKKNINTLLNGKVIVFHNRKALVRFRIDDKISTE